jgi:hypothetical protein
MRVTSPDSAENDSEAAIVTDARPATSVAMTMYPRIRIRSEC